MCFIAKSWYNRKRGVAYESKKNYICPFSYRFICFCLWKMNEHYDELARYPYELTDEQRNLVLEHFDTEEINYLVTQKLNQKNFFLT